MECQRIQRKKILAALLCGMLGCICFGAGDWLMLYGDTAYTGNISWLTEGAAQIAPWRNALAMLLSFPGIILYGIALFAIACFLNYKRRRKIYRCLTAFSLTPWLCLHLFYIMILYVFAWMNSHGYEAAALPVSEALFTHLSWIVILSEAMMLPPYLYWFYLLIRKNSVFTKWMAISNPLIIYGILKLVTMLMPDGAFRIGFTNGLMSESMMLWFGSMMLWCMRCLPSKEGNENGKY